jgi:hypothetical protein
VSNGASLTYCLYVQATAERVWRAFDGPCHSTMGGKTFPSEWITGSTWDLVHVDVGLVVSDPE